MFPAICVRISLNLAGTTTQLRLCSCSHFCNHNRRHRLFPTHK